LTDAALRLATRGSPQARTQAQFVADAITAATGRAAELVVVETSGDRQQAVPLHTIGGQGVFVKEVQEAVIDGRADAAVHSAKDLPSATLVGLHIAAYCARRDAADALVGRRLDELDHGAVVASGSVRRRAQLASVRPDLQFVELRGNIARRLEKVPPGGAIVMAVAALEVLGLTDRIAERLDPTVFVPAVGQGCVAIECRADDAATTDALAGVDDASTRFAVSVERAFLAELGAGCSLPLGAYCAGGRLFGYLAGAIDAGSTAFRETIAVPADLDLAAGEAAAMARRARSAVAA
jgi:hydroxymethylbilane synthase